MVLVKHHPHGPSRQKNLEECCGFLPTNSTHENTFLGKVCHQIWDTGDRLLADNLPDPDFALGLVTKVKLQWAVVKDQFEGEYGRIKQSSNEHFLNVPSLNFGTCDRLEIARRAALIGDGKFGWWKVEHANTNLQGHNYAILVWELYPDVDIIWMWFGNPRLDDYTLGKFTRGEHYPLFRSALVKRLSDAANPDPAKFKFNELNCSFCSRLDCPVRKNVAMQTLEYLEDHDPMNMTLEELNNIKKITNSLKTLTKRVDDEAKTRVLDDGEPLNDFVIKEKVHSREVIGQEHIAILVTLLAVLLPSGCNISELISISFSDVEQLIVHSVGDYRRAKPIISKLIEELEAAKALTTSKYYMVAAKNESIEK